VSEYKKYDEIFASQANPFKNGIAFQINGITLGKSIWYGM